MFTGIIECTGMIVDNQKLNDAQRLFIAADFTELQTGESIAVNGVCLTLLPSTNQFLTFDVSTETLQRTTLAHLSAGDQVNLERAMLATTRFGGHYVSGHVDALSQVKHLKRNDDFMEIELGEFTPQELLYLLPKGSITVDGVSLTINAVTDATLKLMLIPHTLANTNLNLLKPGQAVNIEFDYLARIVAHQLAWQKN